MSDPHTTPGHSSSDEAPKDKKLSKMKILWSFLRNYKIRMALALFFLTIAATTVLVIPTALQGMVDNGFSNSDAQKVNDYFVIFLAIVGVMAFSTAMRFYYVSWLGERVVADIRKAVYERLITMSPEFFETNRPGEIVSRLTADTTVVQTIVGSSFSVWLRNVLIALVGTIWLFIQNPGLMTYVMIGIPVTIFILVLVGRRVRNLSRKSQDRVADVGARANESLAALNVVQAFTRENEESRRFSGATEEAFIMAQRRITVRSALTAGAIFIIFSSIAAVLYSGAQDVMQGTMTGGELLEFIIRSVFVAGAYGALSEVYSDLQRAAGAAGRLAELLAVVPTIKAPEAPVALPEQLSGQVSFEDVTFAYPSKLDYPALHEFTLNVKEGETVALVGPSGAGKSTVLQLLLRFYDPQQGKVSYDGINIQDCDPSEFREHLAFVPQETIIFADTVSENLRYGRLEATQDEIVAAAESASALEFIERQPEGFDTYLGERGTRLSGGQRQRLAIARAILRDAPLLLLDEATSALDAESERKVQLALDELMKGRTTIVIAHRLATVKKADRIVVMDEGRIVAEGSHEDLMQQDGLYKRLADLQFGPAG
ncbi:ABC transporter transmembrane domain-containing protein [Temperatibacter marinus]|uniref:ABC transporter transmembrane domain-containing protein n=1 Tax=Temperatibacter marinus TaxID=1456591 RepID=A0AA52H8V8_9PROT|nr:ABC transporter transmembrane domain-containing protein [Temperatibacter marinus]WND01867.1 ABC transporter transmembrane domain-containing protein [Temperatibacter marinus]